MKILHVSDLHARRPWLGWISAHATEFDLLCIAGDLLDMFGPERPKQSVSSKPSDLTRMLRPTTRVPLHEQARILSIWLQELPTPTVVCTGNHDWWPRDARVTDVYAAGGWLQMLAGKGNVIAIDGSTAMIGGLKVASIGWNQPTEWPDGTDIVICHAPPPSTPVAGADSGLGCEPDQSDLWQKLWTTPPQFYLCGHIHGPRKNSYWFPPGEQQTLILNPGCDFNSPAPYRWEIDTDRGLAVFHGAKPNEVQFIEPHTAARFVRAKAKAREIFATDSAAEEWLRTPAPALGRRRPVDLLNSDEGESSVIGVIEGIAHGNIL